MALTFKNYLDGVTTIKPSKDLVLGWLTEDFAAGTETRYALFWGGRVLCSTVRAPCHDFDYPGRRWAEVNEIPAGAQFIGNYKPPQLVTGA